jgi:uncharacterized protein (TIGR00297 family)
MHSTDLPILLLLAAAATASAYWKKLTPTAALTGFLIGWSVYTGDGYRGLIELALFFLLGTAATSWGKEKKRGLEGNAAHEPTRTPGQVLANGGVAAIAGIGSVLLPGHSTLFALLISASLSSATADTLSSELGMIYGRRFYNILTLKPDQRGLDGVISIEGTLIGIAGSAVIAIAFMLTGHPGALPALIILLAGTAGNLFDSLLGALFERKGLLSNNTVNFLNTLAAALLACGLALLSGYPS